MLVSEEGHDKDVLGRPSRDVHSTAVSEAGALAPAREMTWLGDHWARLRPSLCAGFRYVLIFRTDIIFHTGSIAAQRSRLGEE